MTRNGVLKRAKKIFDKNNVIYSFSNLYRGGKAWPRDGLVEIGTLGYTPEGLASTICHELAHILLFRKGKFIRYHDYGINDPFTIEMAKMRLQIGLRAELYTDKIAKRLMKAYYPGMKFIGSYSRKFGRDWYRENMLKPCKEFLESSKNA